MIINAAVKGSEHNDLEDIAEGNQNKNKTYEDGLSDAWEAARKIISLSREVKIPQSACDIIETYSVKEALEMLRQM